MLTHKNIIILKTSYTNNLIEAGCDEAGRGCLSGAVFAAAVILPKDFSHSILTDSKMLSEKNRNLLKTEIEQTALAYAVGIVSEREIEKINILHASILAMHRALDGLKISPEFIIVDGNKFKKYKTIPHQTVVKGDAKYFSIAAASVLAKTYRDEYMMKISKEFPVYNWHKNKGYATKEHRQAIEQHGICKYHRRTFIKSYNNLKLDFNI